MALSPAGGRGKDKGEEREEGKRRGEGGGTMENAFPQGEGRKRQERGRMKEKRV